MITGDNRLRQGFSGYIKPFGQAPSKPNVEPVAHQTASPSGALERELYVPSSPLKPPLSKERRSELLKALAEETMKISQRHAVVVGGGPGGLAAAITLAQRGMKVTVLEARANETGDKPAHARPHQISLRQDSLEMLKKLGAYDQVIEKSGFVDKEVHIHRDGLDHKVHEKKPLAMTQDHSDDARLNPNTLLTDSVSQVRISDIEKALLEQAVKLGVDVRSGVQADLKPSANGTSYDVETRKVRKEADGYKAYGEATQLGTPDLVVVADGAGSPTRAALGINVLEQSPKKHYLGGHVQKGISAETRKATVIEPNGMKRHVMGTGHTKYDQTWVSVEITPEEAALAPQERAKLLADKAQYVMGDKVAAQDIGWGAGQLTTVQNRRAEKTTAGDNVVLLGDAAGTGSVWVGGGLNLALTTHLSAVRDLATRIGTSSDRGQAMKIYDKTLQWATTVWHRAGATELGVKEGPGPGPETLRLWKPHLRPTATAVAFDSP